MRASSWGSGEIYFRNRRYHKYSSGLNKRDAKNLARQLRYSGQFAHFRKEDDGKYAVYRILPQRKY